MAGASHADNDNASIGRGQGIEAAPEQPGETSNGASSVSITTDATAVVRFRIGGWLRFLSHAETLRTLERACTRAQLPIKYTQGFNPHPKLSLPLPRTVGVESDDELMAVKLFRAEGLSSDGYADGVDPAWPARMKEALAHELPGDIVIDSVSMVEPNARIQPRWAEYVFSLQEEERAATIERIENRIAEIRDIERLTIERATPNQREGRRIDVKPFIESIRVEDGRVVARCHVSNAGTIRVDEIMTLLELTPGDLDGPIRRAHVAWDIA